MNIELTKDRLPNVTILSNTFIDHDMIHADGEYVKIYLMLIRLISSGQFTGVDQIADLLELTQKDVHRALKHWEKQGLITLSEAVAEKREDLAQQPIYMDVQSNPLPEIPPKESLPPTAIQRQLGQAELRHSTFMAEAFLGRPLTTTELNSFCYIDTALSFSPDLLEYLIEYCVSKDKKSVRYMESVAINWYQQGIDTVDKAKAQSAVYQNHTFSIMKAFGLGNRNPGRAELDYIKKWNLMGFDYSIIEEAINRTLITTHSSSFPYANSILEAWKKAGVTTLEEIRKLDSRFHASTGQNHAVPASQSAQNHSNQKSSNRFHNFEQRDYDFDDLESRLLHTGV